MSVKDSTGTEVFYLSFLYTEEMLHRHGLLSIKDVFLRSVTIKNITPLLHSSSTTDTIKPSSFEEDNDDTERVTIQEEGHKCSP